MEAVRHQVVQDATVQVQGVVKFVGAFAAHARTANGWPDCVPPLPRQRPLPLVRRPCARVQMPPARPHRIPVAGCVMRCMRCAHTASTQQARRAFRQSECTGHAALSLRPAPLDQSGGREEAHADRTMDMMSALWSSHQEASAWTGHGVQEKTLCSRDRLASGFHPRDGALWEGEPCCVTSAVWEELQKCSQASSVPGEGSPVGSRLAAVVARIRARVRQQAAPCMSA